jgi:hypothetical protein
VVACTQSKHKATVVAFDELVVAGGHGQSSICIRIQR